MKNMKHIPTFALLTALVLCIASPMAMAGLQKGTKTATTGKTTVDNPEPITGMLALAAAGVGGLAARKRKQKSEEE